MIDAEVNSREQIQLNQIVHSVKVPLKVIDILPYVPPNIRNGKREIIKPPVVFSDTELMNTFIQNKENAKKLAAEKRKKVREEKKLLAQKSKKMPKTAILKRVRSIISERKKKLRAICALKKDIYEKNYIGSGKERKKAVKEFAKDIKLKLQEKLESLCGVEESKKLASFFTEDNHFENFAVDLDLNL